jgi:FkbM family methyltransferase
MADTVIWTQSIRSALKRTAGRLGFQVERRGRRQHLWLKQVGIRTVPDVGANRGQFAAAIRTTLPGARIYAFEPLRDCFDELEKLASRDHQLTPINVALGDVNGPATFNRNRFTPSSSMLEVERLHDHSFPFTSQIGQVQVDVRRLDDLAGELSLTPQILVKLDVQGYEDRVISGGKEVLRQASVIIIEVSFRRLYAGQKLFDELHRQLAELGFGLHGFNEQIRSPIDDEVLSADAIYMHE